MKFSKLSQLFLVSTLGLLVAVALSGCMIVTIDYVFVADSTGNSTGSAGQIQIFAVDSQSGALRQGATTVASGGVDPVSMATTGDYSNLYVVNASSNNLVHFAVSGDGQLTAKETTTLPDTPVAVAVNPTANYLYVLYGSSSATLAVYTLSSGTVSSSALATYPLTLSGYTNDTIVPTALNVLVTGTQVYATIYDQSAYYPSGKVTSSAHPGWIFGFTVGSTGTLTATTSSPYQSGVKPSAVTSDPTYRFVYVTDYASNALVGFTVGTNGQLTYMLNGPFKTGNEPTGVAVDPRAKYIYVSNGLDNSVSAYSITYSSGAPSTIVNSASTSAYATDTQPVAIAVDPALGRFVYTTNRLGDSISGFRLNADTGVLATTLTTPYVTDASPTALVIVPHGNHAIQSVAQ